MMHHAPKSVQIQPVLYVMMNTGDDDARSQTSHYPIALDYFKECLNVSRLYWALRYYYTLIIKNAPAVNREPNVHANTKHNH